MYRKPSRRDNLPFRWCAVLQAAAVVALLLFVASCGGPRVTFIYPDEQIDFRLPGREMPALYIDTVTDMRPPEQRRGGGRFIGIDFPGDSAWDVPAARIYAEALAQDLQQTHLVELVPLPGQADYLLSVDLLAMGCRLERSGGSLGMAAAIGAGTGLALGDGSSRRIKLGLTLAAVGLLAIPVATSNQAEAEVRMTLKDRDGNILWQKACLGEFSEKMHMAATARRDQELVTRHLTKAVKRANACLVGQLQQAFLDLEGGAP